MKIIDLLSKDAVLLNSAVGSKAEAIDNAIRLMEGNGNITDPEKYRRERRERLEAKQAKE